MDIEKCTSSKTERDTKIAELMTTAPPTKPNTNSSMHPGLMALRWHGEMQEPRLRRGQGSIFVVKVCHWAAATETMPSTAAFHYLLQQLQSKMTSPRSPPPPTKEKGIRAASLFFSIYAASNLRIQASSLAVSSSTPPTLNLCSLAPLDWMGSSGISIM